MASSEAVLSALQAAASGSASAVAELRRLLQSGEIDSRAEYGGTAATAMTQVIKGGGKGRRRFTGKGCQEGNPESNVEAVKLLLEHNSHPNYEMRKNGPDEGITMTMMAIIMGQEGALRALLEANADIEAQIMTGEWSGALLSLAAGGLSAPCPEMTKVLLELKADIHAIDNGGEKGKAGKGGRPKSEGKSGGNHV